MTLVLADQARSTRTATENSSNINEEKHNNI